MRLKGYCHGCRYPLTLKARPRTPKWCKQCEMNPKQLWVYDSGKILLYRVEDGWKIEKLYKCYHIINTKTLRNQKWFNFDCSALIEAKAQTFRIKSLKEQVNRYKNERDYHQSRINDYEEAMKKLEDKISKVPEKQEVTTVTL